MNQAERVPVAVPAVSANQAETLALGTVPAPIRATTSASSRRRSSSRVGRRGLAAVRASLSARDWQVLESVARHRYLTTCQVEGFHFHHHASAASGARMCRRVLRRLAGLRVLDALERRIGGVRAGSASYIWQVGPVGDRLLRDGTRRPRLRQHESGLMFLRHRLATADAHLALVRAERRHELELVGVQTEPECWRPFTGLGGARLVLQSDLYAVTVDPSDATFVNRWFIEIDCGTENPARLLVKCERYETYRATGAEQADSGSFPLVVWVMRDQQSVERLAAAIARSAVLDHRLYRVITADQLVELIRSGVA